MADLLCYPHPLVTSNVLYVRDVPFRVKWDNLVTTFKACGPVSQLEVTTTKGTSKKNRCRTWAVCFQDIAHAELAFATLRGTSIKDLPLALPCPLTLFHSAHPSESDASSASWALPQYVVGVKLQALAETNIFSLFSIFRRAGPLVSLRLDVDIGRDAPVCVVRYWSLDHADAAAPGVTAALRERFQLSGIVSLKSYDPCTILITNLDSGLEANDIHGLFNKFGTIIE
ncbi:uncharacterized protein PHACADRAFT_214367 [Phanerochaete carnosa HHB-10118-sp]|uniref:RRM domain-containing protein n=1 Tax=Phanerochaete carnosa (strain HHB-10118-sp) TaxID=650164 RepID=K5UJX3_PHACS|nr:uncharacterized protein PHACADRAFT_214367 [Phanerochaete carnosa HHB-10118-sp]EKM49851.1 hypothetical protein PHACADRAFT_214367 [Phanerochaete carnosa HHB-10118-sp]